MDVAATRARHRELKERAFAITDAAIADDRKLTEEEAKQISELVSEAKDLAAELESNRLGGNDELLEQLAELSRRQEMWALDPGSGMKANTYGDMPTLGLKNAEKPHPWATGIVEACKSMGGAKAFGTPTGSVPLVPLSTVPVSMGMLGAPLVAAIGLRPWPAGRDGGGRAVTYLRQTGRTNRAAIWHRGSAADGSDTAAKPVSDLHTEAVEANAETIAHLASPVKREDLADFTGLNRWVASELAYGISQALEAAVLTAPGPEPDMTGLLELPGTTPVPLAGDAAGTIEAASVALSNLGYGDGLQAAINPTDWSGIATAKGTDGHYLFPTLPTGAATPSLFGVGVIASPNVPTGTAIVANFRGAVQLYEREGVRVEWGTPASAPFEKNLISALAEGRYAMTVPQPAAVAIADLTP